MNEQDRWEVIYSGRANKNLQEIYEYIAEATLEPDIAEKQVARIKEAADSLDFMPHRHRLHYNERLRAKGVHRLLVDNYIIFYKIDETSKCVKISHVIHNKRNIDSMIDEIIDEPEE
jgi:toxin ParE1/3/4